MLEIRKPEAFINNIKILNLILGFILILIGLIYEIGLIIRIFIVQGYYGYPIIRGLFGILLISTGIMGLLSGFFLLKSKFLGLKLSMLTFIMLSGTLIYIATYIFIHDLLRQLSSLHHFAQSFRFFYYTGFLFYTVIALISIILFLSIYKNKDLLKECFLLKTCYNCQALLKPPFKFCANCGVNQGGLKITSPSKFILKIRFFNFFLGIFFILIGSYGIYGFFLSYYSFVTGGHTNLFSLIRLFIYTILSIIVGAIGILSSLFFKNLKFFGIKLSIILYILICAFSFLLSIDLIVFIIWYERGYIVFVMLLAYVFILFLNLSLFIPSILLFLKMFKNRDILREYFSTKSIIEKRKKMLEIKKPESFINNIKIMNLILGFILILIGLNYEIRLIIRIFIVKGYFRDPIIWGLFGILLISSGIIGLLSWYFLLESKFLGLELSMLFFIVLSGTFVYMATHTIIYTVLGRVGGLLFAAQSVRILFYSGIVVISIILLLAIYKNKDLLKECF